LLRSLSAVEGHESTTGARSVRTLDVDLHNDTVRAGGAPSVALVVTFVSLLHRSDQKLRVTVPDLIPTDRHLFAIASRPRQHRHRTAHTISLSINQSIDQWELP